MKRIIACIGLFLLVNTAANAKVILPAVIDNNMVLQQKTNAALWGKARPAAKVKVTTSWNGKSYTAQAGSDSLWNVSVSTPAAGGPFSITFDDGEKLVLKNILIGEVWVCSGQSNMSMPVKGFRNQPVEGSNDMLMNAKNPKIRLFQIPRQFSDKAQFDAKVISWEEADVESVSEMSAVAYLFGKIIQEKLDVPVGIIHTSWGGTRIEAWMSPSTTPPASGNAVKLNQNSPSVLFNAMIHPILGFSIKGVLWYQGEANRKNPQAYPQQMQSMVADWRKRWNCGEWPFYYVQIAPFKYDNDKQSAYLREAQLQALQLIPNSAMAVTADAGQELSIHPPYKMTVAKRLAYAALARDYGFSKLPYQGPVYKSMKISKDTIDLIFDHAENGLYAGTKDLTLFEIAGEDKVFHAAEAKITATGIRVRSNDVKNPVAVRYAFNDWFTAELYNNEGLPASSFRTDTW
ncbi:sialate O-acetylesterase [Chitinophaga sp. SYP-B3965]|uniref:sialate O-acetylesterase n=1 Tax=Chitinophaga sp. SYP-B3965 TaxID=2663120 RepID=UPI00129974D8|nr:sialate O-acetylesterase [Chitinophaga sp. SYP-B3965]MRG45706.1 sialate O-acetylesterase [Chitinophaga sp. SYP-B3965]